MLSKLQHIDFKLLFFELDPRPGERDSPDGADGAHRRRAVSCRGWKWRKVSHFTRSGSV